MGIVDYQTIAVAVFAGITYWVLTLFGLGPMDDHLGIFNFIAFLYAGSFELGGLAPRIFFIIPTWMLALLGAILGAFENWTGTEIGVLIGGIVAALVGFVVWVGHQTKKAWEAAPGHLQKAEACWEAEDKEGFWNHLEEALLSSINANTKEKCRHNIDVLSAILTRGGETFNKNAQDRVTEYRSFFEAKMNDLQMDDWDGLDELREFVDKMINTKGNYGKGSAEEEGDDDGELQALEGGGLLAAEYVRDGEPVLGNRSDFSEQPDWEGGGVAEGDHPLPSHRLRLTAPPLEQERERPDWEEGGLITEEPLSEPVPGDGVCLTEPSLEQENEVTDDDSCAETDSDSKD